MREDTADDVDGFVVARWPDLEAVALVATLDPATAHELTAGTLTALRARWREVTDGGAPTREAQRELLRRVGRSGRPRRFRRRPAVDAAHAVDPAVRDAAADPGSSVPDRLLDVLEAQTPLVRAAGAAAVLWDLPEHGLRDVLGTDADDALAGVAAARERLLAAHRAARVADGLEPADHRVDDDLADLLHRLGAARAGAPDADELVRRRASGLRRRSLVTGAAGVVGVAGAGAAAWALTRDPPRPAVAPSPPGLPGPDDPSWSRTGTWAPRGSLRTDARIPAVLVAPAAPGAQVVYAGDVEGLRVVVASRDAGDALSGELLAWTGAAGTTAEQLSPVQLGNAGLYDPAPVIGVALPHRDGALVLVLARPTVGEAGLSFTVQPRPDGTIERPDRRTHPLEAGVGTVVLDRRPGLAARLTCDGYDGPLPHPLGWDAPDGSDGVFDAPLVDQVAAATGLDPDRLRSMSRSYTLPGRQTVYGGSVEGTVTVRVDEVTTPDGALVRSTRLGADTEHGRVPLSAEPPFVIPTDRADAPVVVQVDHGDEGDVVTAVVAGPPAATVRVGTDAGPGLGTAVRVRDEVALVRTEGFAGIDRVVVRDVDGSVLFDDEPVLGTFLYDLFPG